MSKEWNVNIEGEFGVLSLLRNKKIVYGMADRLLNLGFYG